MEYSPRPEGRQQALARDLAQAGASAIIGTHPHAVQPLTVEQGTNGRKTPVAYSTGNFIAVQNFQPAKTGALVALELCRTKGAAGLSVGRIGWIATQMEFTAQGMFLSIAPRDAQGARANAYSYLSRIAPGFSAQPASCPAAGGQGKSATSRAKNP